MLAAASRLGWLAAASEVVGTAGRRVEAAILEDGTELKRWRCEGAVGTETLTACAED